MELLDPTGGPENVQRVAAGEAEFCLTSVAHYLRAWSEADALPARFVAVVVQRSPMAAIVAADSPLREVDDLPGGRVGGQAGDKLVAAYLAGLAHLGLGVPPLVAVGYADAPAALGRGDIDVVADFADLVPRVRRQSGIQVRAIPLGTEIYASGLVAGDDVPDAAVERMRASIVDALEGQRREPERGLDALVDRYPGVDPDDALEGWSLVEPNIFSGAVGSMDPERWETTITHLSAVLGLPAPPPPAVYRLLPTSVPN